MAEEAKSRTVTLSAEAFAVVMRQVKERGEDAGVVVSRSSVASAIILESEAPKRGKRQ